MRTSSPNELMMRLDRRASPPLRVQLEQQLRDGIRNGSLAPGMALPSTRALAAELAVSRGLVVEAYAQLGAEGYLVTRPGGATRISEAAAGGPAARSRAELPRAPRYDFRPGAPDVSLFPARAWLASVRRGLARAPHARFDYGDPRGAPELRVALAEYLGRVRGVVASPDSLVVTSGLAQGLVILTRALVARGAGSVGVEDPGSAPLWQQVAGAGLSIVPVPVDAGGVQVDRLGDLAAIVLTPAHQFPTGVVLAPDRRAGLLDWAARRGAVIVEDDYDAEYRYDRPPVGAMQGLDPRNVVYGGSVSKTLAPALRLGWLVVPDRLALDVAGQKAADDLGTPIVDQLALADFIARGELDRHLRASRLEYRRRRDAVVDALARRVPEARVGGIAAGLHVAVYLPEGTDESRVLEAARARDVGVFGLSEHRTGPGPPALLLGYGRIPVPAIDPGIRALSGAIDAAWAE
jgi:GntR family transcriptional regulator/MocR family aminotransferase